MTKNNRKIGIYKIEDTESGKVYIGSSCNILERFYAHRYDLRNNGHHNYILQNIFNKRGDVFIFEILEECPEEDLILRETQWISKFCNNINLVSPIENLKSRQKTIQILDENDVVISITNISKFCADHGLNKVQMGLLGMGKRLKYKNYKTLKYYELLNNPKPHSNSVHFKLRSPCGKIHEGHNISKFSKEHGICMKNLYKVIKGERPHAQGWTLC